LAQARKIVKFNMKTSNSSTEDISEIDIFLLTKIRKPVQGFQYNFYVRDSDKKEFWRKEGMI
jgi:hypothetical protein